MSREFFVLFAYNDLLLFYNACINLTASLKTYFAVHEKTLKRENCLFLFDITADYRLQVYFAVFERMIKNPPQDASRIVDELIFLRRAAIKLLAEHNVGYFRFALPFDIVENYVTRFQNKSSGIGEFLIRPGDTVVLCEVPKNRPLNEIRGNPFIEHVNRTSEIKINLAQVFPRPLSEEILAGLEKQSLNLLDNFFYGIERSSSAKRVEPLLPINRIISICSILVAAERDFVESIKEIPLWYRFTASQEDFKINLRLEVVIFTPFYLFSCTLPITKFHTYSSPEELPLFSILPGNIRVDGDLTLSPWYLIPIGFLAALNQLSALERTSEETFLGVYSTGEVKFWGIYQENLTKKTFCSTIFPPFRTEQSITFNLELNQCVSDFVLPYYKLKQFIENKMAALTESASSRPRSTRDGSDSCQSTIISFTFLDKSNFELEFTEISDAASKTPRSCMSSLDELYSTNTCFSDEESGKAENIPTPLIGRKITFLWHEFIIPYLFFPVSEGYYPVAVTFICGDSCLLTKITIGGVGNTNPIVTMLLTDPRQNLS